MSGTMLLTIGLALITAILVPVTGWAAKSLITQAMRIVKLETRLDNLETGVAKDVKELKTSFGKLDAKLQAHMDGEVEALRHVIREELRRGD